MAKNKIFMKYNLLCKLKNTFIADDAKMRGDTAFKMDDGASAGRFFRKKSLSRK